MGVWGGGEGGGREGPQNATALSPPSRPPQPSEHETHLMWAVRGERKRIVASPLVQSQPRSRRLVT